MLFFVKSGYGINSRELVINKKVHKPAKLKSWAGLWVF